jgi:GTP diphosphokinase / guanosine-3',5'-bis(diphosphate) 3'-diphosphatase
MNVAAPPAPITYDVNLPDWLRENLETFPPCQAPPSPDQPLQLVSEAFDFAYRLHEGQSRRSGDPYIAHPIAVAGLLRELGGSPVIIAAGFLHDVVEDTDITVEEIETRFGPEVRHLVEGVTKLSKFNFTSKTEHQAENFRRMFLAMAQDIRVIMVKLADRLHNMRTLEHLPEQKQRRIAKETHDIFAPLANRLGIGRVKWELEDLSFKFLDPEGYREVQSLVAEKRADREARLASAVDILHQRLEQTNLHPIDVSGRPKHLFSIYRKMHRQQKEFHEIYDVAALRILVNTPDECYRALAVVHDVFKPVPGRFKDYIGLPKANRYQSLHTTVIGQTGQPMEVQIRTLEMHQIAEYGIAAHWKYKEVGHSASKFSTEDEKFTWLRQLLEWQHDLKDAKEYLENIKDNLFDEDVFAFTPKGDVFALAQGSTPVDFAYRIHTEVGNRCCGAKINGRIVTLGTPLQNGDIVEILTQKNARPSLDWLNFVVTSGAKNRIRQWYKRSNREENLIRGRELLERELGKKGFEALLKSTPMQQVAERCNYTSPDDLLAAIGYGEVTLNLIVNRIREAVKTQRPLDVPLETTEQTLAALQQATMRAASSDSAQRKASQSPIVGVEGLVYRLARCCSPLPGEAILGLVSLGNHGISIHRQSCTNLEGIAGDRLIPVSWNTAELHNGRPSTYPVNVQIEVIDRVGVLKDILTRLSDNNINVSKAQVKTAHNKPAIIDLCIELANADQLHHTFAQIKQMSDILNIRRLNEGNDEKH